MQDNLIALGYPYPVEEIPDNATLYYRIHKVNIDEKESDKKKKIMPGAFDPHPSGSSEMSVDWSQYSNAIQLKERAKNPEKNGVVSFNSTEIRSNPFSLEVRHAPTRNQAHSLIFDVPLRKNDIGIRIKLRAICVWEISI